MNKDTIFTVIKNVLTIAGAFLLGKNLFGHAVDEALWQEWLGGIMSVIAVVWSFVDKTSTLEAFQGGLRYVITFFGTFLVTKGIISEQVFITISAAIIAIVPIIYRELSKEKSKQIASGELGIADLAGVKEEVEKGIPITPVMSTPK